MAERVGHRLRQARKLLGLTLKEAATAARFRNYQTLAKMEDGTRSVKAAELARLADVYAQDISYFLTEPIKRLRFRICWRKSEDVREQPRIQQQLQMLLERYLSLEKKLGLEESGPLKMSVKARGLSYSAATELGEEYSRLLGLGQRPALTLADALENDQHVPVFYYKLPRGLSAAAIFADEVGAVCVNANEPPWRRTYDLAHEFFHLIHLPGETVVCGLGEKSNVEKWANAFAAGLLLPGDTVRQYLRRFKLRGKNRLQVQVNDLVQMASDFGVSTSALVWRFVNLGLMKKDAGQKLLGSSALAEHDREIRLGIPWEAPHLSRRFLSMVFRAVADGLLSRAKAAEYLMVQLADLDATFLREGFTLENEYATEVPLA